MGISPHNMFSSQNNCWDQQAMLIIDRNAPVSLSLPLIDGTNTAYKDRGSRICYVR